jgi:hypothetical protein
MELQPVQHTKTPSYPTRREVLAGAAGFALAGLCGRVCVFAATEDGKTIVAPLFKHGDGRGATGCVVHSPPVFLSEEEAMQIIREELAKIGVRLAKGDEMKGVRIPARSLDYEKVKKGDGEETYKWKIVEFSDITKPLKLSGIDPAKKIAVEFISEERYSKLGGPLSGSTAQPYNFRETAKYVAAQVKKQSKEAVYLAILYDPAVCLDMEAVHKRYEEIGADAAWKEAEKASKEKARKLLRQQAQDLAAWLKEKKVVE